MNQHNIHGTSAKEFTDSCTCISIRISCHNDHNNLNGYSHFTLKINLQGFSYAALNTSTLKMFESFFFLENKTKGMKGKELY